MLNPEVVAWPALYRVFTSDWFIYVVLWGFAVGLPLLCLAGAEWAHWSAKRARQIPGTD